MGQNIFIQEQDEDIIIWSSKKGGEQGEGVPKPAIPTGINLVEI